MKKTRILLALILVFAIAMTGCGKKDDTGSDTNGNLENTSFNYSSGLDKNGYWDGVKASDYVTLGEYKGISIPASEIEVDDETLESNISSILENYKYTVENYDDEAELYDTVSIAYIGRIDGKEFDGGSGTKNDLVLGSGTFISGFEDGIIGHMPGETFMLDLTFPSEYGSTELAGKDAQFEVTLNYIVDTVKPELTDELIAEQVGSDYDGVRTVEEFEAKIKELLKEDNTVAYISSYIAEFEASDIPEAMIQYQKDSMKAYYEEYAAMYGMEVNDLITAMGLGSSIDEVVLQYEEELKDNAKYYLILQAIAEKENIKVSDKDVKEYFLDITGEEDYSTYEEYFGINYIKCMITGNKVIDLIKDNAVITD